MFALVATLGALALAPLADRIESRALRSFDLVLRLAVLALIGIDVLPHALPAAGLAGLVALVAGLGIGLVTHRVEHEVAALGAAVTGAAILVHALGDGVAIATGDRDGHHLGLAVALHTLPVGMALWRVVRPRAGSWAAAGVLALAGLGTVLGVLGGDALPPEILDVATCGSSGLLLAVVLIG